MSEKVKRKYYSSRNGTKSTQITLEALRDIFLSIFNDFNSRGYFDEYFGIDCVDDPRGSGSGKIENIENYILRKLRKKNIWPITENYENYTEEDVFDVIEFLFDHISSPMEEGADHHGWGDCGWHYTKFDKFSGEIEFLTEINEFLSDYKDGYSLEMNGEIFSKNKSEEHLRPLLDAKLTSHDPTNVENKIEEAISKFKRYKSTLQDRKEAIRMLADCLEFIRPSLKKVLDKKDENDLFVIANNFGIRHHNKKQKMNYDQNIWLSWMFYFYLATLHAALRLLEKKK